MIFEIAIAFLIFLAIATVGILGILDYRRQINEDTK